MPASHVTNAQCTACGGQVPLQLAQPMKCGYCGAVDALDARVRAAVEAVRRRIARRGAQVQQFLAQEGIFTEEFWQRTSTHFPLLVVLWLLVGGIFLGTAGEMLGKGRSPWPLFTGVQVPATDDEKLVFFLAFAVSIAAVFSFSLPTLGLFSARRAAISTRPLAPIAPGAPPRCRCCMATLAESGTVRRCAYCGADHLVLDERYRAEQQSLDAAVAAAVAEGARSLQSRLKLAEGLVSWALASAIFSLPVVPIIGGIAFALFAPTPKLFLVPALAGTAALGAYVQLWRKVHALRPATGAARAEPPPIPRASA